MKNDKNMTAAVSCALTIAGSDSGGGAGIQADLKTFTMHHVYGLSVVTALTAQNTMGVHGIYVPDPGFVALQLEKVLEDFPVKAAKTGMLFSSEIIEEVAGVLRSEQLPLVVDPVCVSQTGHKLLKDDAVQALKKEILPLAALITPNKPEAELLCGISIDSMEDVLQAMNILMDMGVKAVLIKGGHFEVQDEMVDWLGIAGADPVSVVRPRISTRNTHGTGCTLSAAITANVAKGQDITAAVQKARDYLQKALETSFDLGHGDGPVNHLL
ncbi:bifunctional hydroxymethylpyrimidine kinase/phosphomethylpyrimidine kinase [Desulfonatronovibrio magnus]|uniref:bifunctional hydroxymethylpyrimidine kinase/phosphomethylpyrimidine kinase n=1 Tax=Desulfonatronovibrio magnus TaxID=698827 RepID=UPI000A7DB6A1|nr:bifunctional hydroxymethylpyrimidine kinase/phosphomethylpyrimidine kinase [Desulfonatronovibrio magnus]